MTAALPRVWFESNIDPIKNPAPLIFDIEGNDVGHLFLIDEISMSVSVHGLPICRMGFLARDWIADESLGAPGHRGELHIRHANGYDAASGLEPFEYYAAGPTPQRDGSRITLGFHAQWLTPTAENVAELLKAYPVAKHAEAWDLDTIRSVLRATNVSRETPRMCHCTVCKGKEHVATAGAYCHCEECQAARPTITESMRRLAAAAERTQTLVGDRREQHVDTPVKFGPEYLERHPYDPDEVAPRVPRKVGARAPYVTPDECATYLQHCEHDFAELRDDCARQVLDDLGIDDYVTRGPYDDEPIVDDLDDPKANEPVDLAAWFERPLVGKEKRQLDYGVSVSLGVRPGDFVFKVEGFKFETVICIDHADFPENLALLLCPYPPEARAVIRGFTGAPEEPANPTNPDGDATCEDALESLKRAGGLDDNGVSEIREECRRLIERGAADKLDESHAAAADRPVAFTIDGVDFKRDNLRGIWLLYFGAYDVVVTDKALADGWSVDEILGGCTTKELGTTEAGRIGHYLDHLRRRLAWPAENIHEVSPGVELRRSDHEKVYVVIVNDTLRAKRGQMPRVFSVTDRAICGEEPLPDEGLACLDIAGRRAVLTELLNQNPGSEAVRGALLEAHAADLHRRILARIPVDQEAGS